MSEAYLKLKNIFKDKLKEDILLGRYTTFKIGGPADLFFEANTREELVTIVKEARKLKIPVFVLGGGTNILIGDKGFRGVVVKNLTSSIAVRAMKGSYKHGIHDRQVFVEADSGVSMNKLIRFTLEEGLKGLEMQLGLPGTVGGAVYMNSKWTHPEGYVGDAVHQATLLSEKSELTTVPRSFFHFAYDTSSIQRTNDIVISVVFSLTEDRKENLWKIANESINYRRETQPQGVFSPGCTFRNISKAQALAFSTPNLTTSAGFLIDHAGLKGFSVGDAQISPLHANFIINKGHATAQDVVELIDLARTRVKERFGLMLVEELVKVGEF